MSLVEILLLLLVVGFILWLINTYAPIDGKIKKIINVVAVVGVIFWLLKIFGVFSYLGGIHI